MKIGKFEIKRSWFTWPKLVIIGFILIVALAYCYYLEMMKEMMKPTVTVAKVKKETVPVYIDFVGNTVSKKTVDIRARVEGFLAKRNFVEGDDVKKGDLLYVIDKRPFEASLAQAKGQLARDQASLAFALEQVKRYKPLAEKDYVSQESYDNYVTQANELKAAVKSDRAAVKQAELNLSWCTMYAPFSGRIGRTLVNVGNLVGAAGQDTKLATLVMLDPIFVYFSPSDEQYYTIMKYMEKGDLKVEITLADGTKFEPEGTLNFVDNEVNNNTSTVAMRGIFRNPTKSLLPGVYVDTKLYLDKTEALLIPEKALSVDQGGQFVMIVKSNDEVRRSYVETGAPYGEWRAITKGVKEGEEVIVEGQVMVQVGTKVHTKDMAVGDTVTDVMHQAVLGQ
jgi:RND family efflux transporter MFP subunit